MDLKALLTLASILTLALTLALALALALTLTLPLPLIGRTLRPSWRSF
jgi:hypothetical protein